MGGFNHDSNQFNNNNNNNPAFSQFHQLGNSGQFQTDSFGGGFAMNNDNMFTPPGQYGSLKSAPDQYDNERMFSKSGTAEIQMGAYGPLADVYDQQRAPYVGQTFAAFQ